MGQRRNILPPSSLGEPDAWAPRHLAKRADTSQLLTLIRRERSNGQPHAQQPLGELDRVTLTPLRRISRGALPLRTRCHETVLPSSAYRVAHPRSRTRPEENYQMKR